MKFSSLNRTGLKTLKIKDFSGGLNLCELPTNISDKELKDIKNMRCEGGVLTVRHGLTATRADVIENESIEYED